MDASKKKYILGIDTSCDETSMAIYDPQENVVLSNVISSQVEDHQGYGGVVPELASRKHAENMAVVFDSALEKAKIGVSELESIAVTTTPGLLGCLLVGTSFAKSLAQAHDLKLYSINHLEAHLFSPFIESQPTFPFLGLVVSGGHTAFYLVKGFDDIELVGQTVDDAAGEAYDKTAKLLGLGYPGGPVIDRMAQKGDSEKFAFTIPRVKMGQNFLSFSGMKTAVRKHLDVVSQMDDQTCVDLCASLQRAIVRTLIEKLEYFLSQHQVQAVALSGGVAMNSHLRNEFAEVKNRHGIETFIAQPEYCTDNAAMVAYLAPWRPVVAVKDLGTKATQKIQARKLVKS